MRQRRQDSVLFSEEPKWDLPQTVLSIDGVLNDARNSWKEGSVWQTLEEEVVVGRWKARGIGRSSLHFMPFLHRPGIALASPSLTLTETVNFTCFFFLKV